MDLHPGLYEALVTGRLADALGLLDRGFFAVEIGELADAEAADRLSRHVATLVSREIASAPENARRTTGIRIARALIARLRELSETDVGLDAPLEPGSVLHTLARTRPDGTAEQIARPLTPLLDTTMFTNAPGEPSVGHELRAEIPSADSIDAIVAFIRWSGIQAMIDGLLRHCERGKRLRILTTTYTNSTEQRALDELTKIGAEIKVSYDVSATRLHAKAWLFTRYSGYSTAYIGSSNLSYAAQVTGLEWNMRVAEPRNPDVIAKVAALFATYWESSEFVPYDPLEFEARTLVAPSRDLTTLSPFEIELRPFQEALLDDLELARSQGHSRNLLVAATGTGKTVMAAIDYARLRHTLPRSRLLFVAHREEILEQSRATFRQALREPTFGEKWIGGSRPIDFDHVFGSIQSLHNRAIERIPADHFDVVIVDEFHHAAAPSYEALLEHLAPVELLGLTATPERADGLDVLRYFDGRIAAELRLWDAIDQQYLAPFSYFGIYDGVDLRDVPWRRGGGYEVDALTNVLTSDDAWAHLVFEEVRRKVSDVHTMRALGFCVSVSHARFMAARFSELGLPSIAIWAETPREERTAALRDLAAGTVRVVFTVDLFNEGVDVPSVDTLLMLRPTESATLFLQQLGRGLRKVRGKTVCTVLDFVGQHRQEFRFDQKFRALLGCSRRDLERQLKDDFPFLPAGCDLQLDRIARDVVLRSIRDAIPTRWKDQCAELRTLGDVTLAEYLESTGLELEDIYAGGHSWSEMRRTVGLTTQKAGRDEPTLLRAIGRLLHVDDGERLGTYKMFSDSNTQPEPDAYPERERRLLRMLVASLSSLTAADDLREAIDHLWDHPQVLRELGEVLPLLRDRAEFVDHPLGLRAPVPLSVHSRYTRAEILAAFNIGAGAKPPTWQTGVWWDELSKTDFFAFTLDKSVGGFSPTTRYQDYAISPELIHWESQGATAAGSVIGQRYIHHRDRGTNIVLFTRLRTTDRAFWCLGPASYVSHENERPIAFVWRLHRRLPAELFTSFAAAVA